MKFTKMTTPKLKNAWPNGVRCVCCSKLVKPMESVLVGRERTRGTIAFHRGCLIGLTKKNWPECEFDTVRQSIIDNPEQALL